MAARQGNVRKATKGATGVRFAEQSPGSSRRNHRHRRRPPQPSASDVARHTSIHGNPGGLVGHSDRSFWSSA